MANIAVTCSKEQERKRYANVIVGLCSGVTIQSFENLAFQTHNKRAFMQFAVQQILCAVVEPSHTSIIIKSRMLAPIDLLSDSIVQVQGKSLFEL